MCGLNPSGTDCWGEEIMLIVRVTEIGTSEYECDIKSATTVST